MQLTGAQTIILVCLFLPIHMITSYLQSSIRNSVKIFRRSHLNMFSSLPDGYLAVHVKGMVKQEFVTKFYEKTFENAMNSVSEEGIARFDVLRQVDDPTKFLLLEIYKNKDAPALHKEANHYLSWRDFVAPMMAEPRGSVKYTTIFPPTVNWNMECSASSEFFTTSTKSSQENAPYIPEDGMLAVIVDIEVKPGTENEFIAATRENCQNSIMEPGIHRFDFLRETDNPSKFVLVEVYNNADAPAAHKATNHYSTWAVRVADMMAKPRSSAKFTTLFPSRLYWHRSSYLTHPGEGVVFPGKEEGTRGLSAMMVPSFGFIGPKLAFGRNIAVKALADAVKDLRVTKPFLITGKSGYERYQAIISAALPDFDTSARYALGGEPSVANALEATELAVSKGCDGVIAIGGGSAIDLGKAVSALITNRGDIYDYLEVVGKALPINAKPVPYVAMPTTSGTGAEATKNAVLKCEINNLKVSMRNELMIPSIAIVDPVLTLSCPPETTAHVGLDTLCQVMEPYVSNAANPFTDALSKEAIIRASRSLRRVYADGTDVEAREDMAIASIMGGLCLANAKLGSVHGYAAVLGGKFENAPHGAICACLLPYVMRANIEKLQQMAASDNYSLLKLNRYVDVARMVTGNPSATAIDGAIWTEALVKDLNIPRLSNLCDIKREQFAEIAELTTKTSSNKGNPLPLSIEELDSILQKAF